MYCTVYYIIARKYLISWKPSMRVVVALILLFRIEYGGFSPEAYDELVQYHRDKEIPKRLEGVLKNRVDCFKRKAKRFQVISGTDKLIYIGKKYSPTLFTKLLDTTSYSCILDAKTHQNAIKHVVKYVSSKL